MLKLYIDGDACPVKEHAFKVAGRYGVTVYVVTRVPIFLPRANWIIPQVAGDGFDAVDNWIVEHIEKKNIVLTSDILLAQRCIEKGARAIDPKGRVWDEENIGEAVAMRELTQELRQQGAMNLGPKKMGPSHRSQFLQALDKLINDLRRAS